MSHRRLGEQQLQQPDLERFFGSIGFLSFTWEDEGHHTNSGTRAER
jgi:hypothetical protein